MVRVYTTRAKKSSVFLCFFIKNFSGFSISRVVTVSIPVFSRVCGIFYENVLSAFEIVSAGNFGQKTTIQSDLLDGRKGDFRFFSFFCRIPCTVGFQHLLFGHLRGATGTPNLWIDDLLFVIY